MGRKKLVGGRCRTCFHQVFPVFTILSNSPDETPAHRAQTDAGEKKLSKKGLTGSPSPE
jgi:hypothetical protein